MAEDLAALWNQAKPVAAPAENLSALWEKAKPVTSAPDDIAGTFKQTMGQELGALGNAATGFVHGISSGTGPISTIMKRALFRPEDLAELEKDYQSTPDSAGKSVGSFAGSAYTPDMAVAGQVGGNILGAGIKTAAGPVGKWLERIGLSQGKRVLTGGANPLAVARPLTDDATKAAFDVGAIAPGRTTQYAANTLKAARTDAGSALGGILKKLEDAGVRGPAVEPLAKALEAKADALAATSVDSEAPDFYRKIADQLRSKTTTGNLGLRQGEAIKQSVTRRVDYEALRKATDMVDARKDIGSMLRQSGEDAVSAGSAMPYPGPDLRDLAAQFVPAKDASGNFIEASKIATKGAAQAARRNMFGLRSVIAATGASTAGTAAFGPTLGALAGPASLVGTHLLETRGTPTAAWAAYKLGQGLQGAGAAAPTAAISKAGPAIAAGAGGLAEWLGLQSAPQPAIGSLTPDGRDRKELEAQGVRSPAPSPGADELTAILTKNPAALGRYAPDLGAALAKNPADPGALAARHFVLWLSDPNYQATLSQALAPSR